MIILVYFVIEYGWRSIQIIIHKTRKKIKKIRLRKKMKELLEKQKQEELEKNNAIDNDYDDVADPKYTGFAYSEDIANTQILMRAQSVKVVGGDVILEDEEDEEDDEDTVDSHLHYPMTRLTTIGMPSGGTKFNSKFKSILEEE